MESKCGKTQNKDQRTLNWDTIFYYTSDFCNLDPNLADALKLVDKTKIYKNYNFTSSFCHNLHNSNSDFKYVIYPPRIKLKQK